MNLISIVGHIGKIEELGHAGDIPAISLGVCTKDYMGKKKGTVDHWHTVNVIGNDAEYIDRNRDKAKKIAVNGKLVFDQWETNDGQKRIKAKIYAETVELLDWRNEGEPSAAPKLQFPG